MSSNLRKNDEWLMDRAAYYASRSTLRYQHGAIIALDNGGELGYGWNVDINFNEYRDKWTLHAEGFAIDRAIHRGHRKNLKGATLYSARVRRNYLDKKASKPCEHCMEMIKAFGIARVVYTNSNGETTPMIIR
jgi:tRNA(Arg) A34 adenosine deaminase TadA